MLPVQRTSAAPAEKEAPVPAPEPAESSAQPETKPAAALDDFDIGENARRLYPYLTNEPQKVDDLIKASGMTPSAVLASLTELECAALCKTVPGQRYLLP